MWVERHYSIFVDTVGDEYCADGADNLGSDINESFASGEASEDGEEYGYGWVALYMEKSMVSSHDSKEEREPILTMSTGDSASNINGHHGSQAPHCGLLGEGSSFSFTSLDLKIARCSNKNSYHRLS